MSIANTLKRIQTLRNIRFEQAAMSLITNPKFGLRPDQVKVVELNPQDYKVKMKDRINLGYFYYYLGPLDEKTRDFCRIILTVDKVFSLADIDELGRKTGYDVFEYMGSYNCRHQWIKFRGEVVSTPPPTDGQINKIARNSIFN